MRILTADGGSVQVRQRAWPLAGLSATASRNQGSFSLPLVGSLERSSYAKLYKTNPWVNASIRSIAWGISRMPINTFELLESGQRERVRFDLPGQTGRPSSAHELDRLLNTCPPTDRGGPQRRMRRTAVDYLVYGNAVWVIEPDGLWHVPWRRINVLQGEDVPVLGYEIIGGTKNRFLAPEQVIHFCAGDDPDGPLGVPPMEALHNTLQLHEALQRHLVKFFENSARPSANLQLEKGATKEVMEAIRGQISDLYASPDNAGKVIVTTGKFEPMTMGHDQSQIIELAKLSREEIAAVFRIPLPVLGALENAIKSNVKELRQQYVRDVIGAWAPAIIDDLMSQLVRPNQALRHNFIEMDMDTHLTPDLEGMADSFTKLERTMTTNERRRKMNLHDLEYPEADTVPSVPGGGYLGIRQKPQAQPANTTPEGQLDPVEPVDADEDLIEDDSES